MKSKIVFGFAQKFVQFFLLDVMEKCKWTFGQPNIRPLWVSFINFI